MLEAKGNVQLSVVGHTDKVGRVGVSGSMNIWNVMLCKGILWWIVLHTGLCRQCWFDTKYSKVRWAGIAQSVSRLATGWMVRGSNPGGDEVFCTCLDRSCGPLNLLHNGYRVSFSGVKRPGRGVDHPPPSSAEVKERVQLYLYSPSGPRGLF
jgi:hypothetical protein